MWVVLQVGSVGYAVAFTFHQGCPAQVPLCSGRQHAGTRDSKRRQNHRSRLLLFLKCARERKQTPHSPLFCAPTLPFSSSILHVVPLGSWAKKKRTIFAPSGEYKTDKLSLLILSVREQRRSRSFILFLSIIVQTCALTSLSRWCRVCVSSRVRC